MSSIPYIRQGSSNVRMPKDYGYVYAEVNNWAGLEDLVDPKEGDVVNIKNLGTGGGLAPYAHRGEAVYTSEGWKLTKAEAFSKVMLDEYITEDGFLAVNGCIGIVCGNIAPTASSKYYYWSESEWLRTPDGTGYIHPTVGTWGALPSDNLQAGDRVFVSDLEPGSGFAQWDGTDWRLVEGVVNTIANLLAFSGEKETGAKVTVGTGIAADPVYFWSGFAWLRTADQSHYVWPQVPDWDALLAPTLARPHAINNDEVHVHDLGPAHSNGTAQMQGGTWKLIEGKWASVSDMNSWPTTDIHSGAIAFIDPTHQYDEDSTVYYRVGSSWVRMANNVPVTFVISSLQDFSGLGLKDGDYGVYTPSGGAPIVMRYKAACDIASGAGDGTTPMWLPPVVYAGTPEIKAYLIGTETVGQLASKGWTVSTIAPGTVGSVASYIQLAGVSGVVSQGAIAAPAITGADKFYLVGEFRGSASGSDPYVGIFGNASASNPSQYALGRGQSSGFIRQMIFTSAWFPTDSISSLQGGGLNWPSLTPYLVQSLSGAVISDVIESRFDGKLYGSIRRNADNAINTSSYALQLLANGGGGLTVSQLELRNLYFMTY